MFEYQVVRVLDIGSNPAGFGRDPTGLIPGYGATYIDQRITSLVNAYAGSGWELHSVSLGGTESSLHALVVFRRAMQ